MKHPFTDKKIPLLVKCIPKYCFHSKKLFSKRLPFDLYLKMNCLKMIHTVIVNASGMLERTAGTEFSESRQPLKIIS